MICRVLRAYQDWRLRRARENYAKWKARHEEWQRQLDHDSLFAGNAYNRHQTIRAAGQAAKYLERVEHLMRS